MREQNVCSVGAVGRQDLPLDLPNTSTLHSVIRDAGPDFWALRRGPKKFHPELPSHPAVGWSLDPAPMLSSSASVELINPKFVRASRSNQLAVGRSATDLNDVRFWSLRTKSSAPGAQSPTAHSGPHGRACTGREEVELEAMSTMPLEYPAARLPGCGGACPAGLKAPTDPGYEGRLGLTPRGRLKVVLSRAKLSLPTEKRPSESRLRDDMFERGGGGRWGSVWVRPVWSGLVWVRLGRAPPAIYTSEKNPTQSVQGGGRRSPIPQMRTHTTRVCDDQSRTTSRTNPCHWVCRAATKACVTASKFCSDSV